MNEISHIKDRDKTKQVLINQNSNTLVGKLPDSASRFQRYGKWLISAKLTFH